MSKKDFATDELIGRYIELRDQIADMKKEYEAKVKPLNEFMQVIASKMLGDMHDSGQKSLKTDRGTAFIKESTFVGVSDWEAALNYIRENEAYDLLTKAVNKTAVKEYLEEHEDIPPPGVNITLKNEVQFRKPSK
jgi:hypothetical protein